LKLKCDEAHSNFAFKFNLRPYIKGSVKKYDPKSDFYKVVYKDGDWEDLEEHELAEVIVGGMAGATAAKRSADSADPFVEGPHAKRAKKSADLADPSYHPSPSR